MEPPRPRPCILEVLNDHILLAILERLQEPADRNNWSLSCKHFRRLRAATRRFASLLRAQIIPSFLRVYTHLRVLDLSSCLEISDATLQCISQLASPRHLRSLNLAKVTTFTDIGLALLARGCVYLTDLDLSFCTQITDRGIMAVAHISSLQSLKLARCEAITDAGLNCVTGSCRKLLQLILRWCSGISDLAVAAIGTNCRELRSLDLSYTEITSIGLASIASLECLEALSLVACHSIDDDGLTHLKNGCKSLQALDVSRCQSLTHVGFIRLAQASFPLHHLTLSYCLPITDDLVQSIRRFDGLQMLRLDGCDVGAADLSSVGVGCKSVKELSLSKCRGVTDTGLCAALAGCRGLGKLDLTCCQELTNLALFSIARFCTGLVSLKMESCCRVTEEGFSALGDACHLLEELDFTDSNLNDTGLLALARCKALKLLKLGFCQSISNKGLEHISHSCSNLLELDVYRSIGVGDAGVASIATGCSRLRIFNLSYCSEITDAALQSISELHELFGLEIRGCMLVSAAGLSAVAKGCHRLEELDVKRCSYVDDSAVLAVAEGCPNLRQINLSYCAVTDDGLLAIAKLNRMQNMKLVHLKNVSTSGFENALLACGSLKKVKLLPSLKVRLGAEALQCVEKRGCRFRWIQKLC